MLEMIKQHSWNGHQKPYQTSYFIFLVVSLFFLECKSSPAFLFWVPNVSFDRFERFAANGLKKKNMKKTLIHDLQHPNTPRWMLRHSFLGFRSELSWGRPTFVQPLKVSWKSSRTSWWKNECISRSMSIPMMLLGPKLSHINLDLWICFGGMLVVAKKNKLIIYQIPNEFDLAKPTTNLHGYQIWWGERIGRSCERSW